MKNPLLWFVGVVTLLLIACGSTDSGSDSCEWADGTVFAASYERTVGNCGPIQNSIVVLGQQQDGVTCRPGSGWVISDGGCSRRLAQVCTDRATESITTFDISSGADGSWTGLFALTQESLTNLAMVCSSNYRVTFTRVH